MAKITWKRMGTDALGYLCLIAVPFVGWLPGPGGIPLLLAGLGLLSIHNDWAKKFLHYVREHSESLREVIFPDKKLIQWLWDIVVVGLIVGGTVLNIYTHGLFLSGISIGMYALSSVLFLFNRHRMRWFENKTKRLRK